MPKIASPGYRFAGGGTGLPTSFSDTLQRAAPIGPNWSYGYRTSTPFTAAICLQDCVLGASSVDGLQCLTWSNEGITNPTDIWQSCLIPSQLQSVCDGRQQFSEWKVIAFTNSGGQQMLAGPSVLQVLGDQGLKCYFLLLNSSTQTMGIFRNDGNNNIVQIGIGGTGFVSGDVLRISATLNVGNTTLIASKNGVTFDTVVDNSGSRLLVGCPGFFVSTMGNTAAIVYHSEWRNFRGGLGLG